MEATNKEKQNEKQTLKVLLNEIKSEYKKEFSLSGLIRWSKNPKKGLKFINAYNKTYADKQGKSPIALSVLNVKDVLNSLSYKDLHSFKLDKDDSLLVIEKTTFSINVLIKSIERQIKGITFDQSEDEINEINTIKAEYLHKQRKEKELRNKYLELGKQAYKA